VPAAYRTSDGYRLGQWVSVQRQKCSSSERRARLDGLGFVWDVLSDNWELGYAELAKYVAERGNPLVPIRYVSSDAYPLGQWVFTQRQRRAQQSSDRRARLDALGFVWAARDDCWDRAYAALAAYVAENGHARVPPGYIADGLGACPKRRPR
jgi:hypothetical protein